MASFMESTQIETWLKQRGVKFDYREQLRFDQLQPGWDAVNHGRSDSAPKDEALIEKYAGAMDQGSIFPAAILAETASGLEVLDGCQRLSAASLCGQTMFAGYVIKTKEQSVRASVRICANSVLNGTSPSQDWTIAKIVDVLHEQHDFSAVDCAQWSGQPVRKIEIEIASREAGNWLKCNGVDISVKPCNQKGFLAAFSKYAPAGDDRYAMAPVLPTLVKQLQSIKANNAEAESLLEQCLTVQRSKGVNNLLNQVRSRIDEVMQRPEIKSRMSAGRASYHPIDNVLRSVQASVTTMRKAARGEYHADFDQSQQLTEMLSEAQKLARRLIPKDIAARLAEEQEAAIA